MKCFIRKIVLFVIVSVLFISTISINSKKVQAIHKNYNDFQIIQDDANKTVLKKSQDNTTVTVTYDRIKGTFLSKVRDNITKDITKYKLDIKTATKNQKEIIYTDLYTKVKYKQIDDTISKISKEGTLQPKLVFAIPIGISITSAAIETMIGIGTAIVIAGVGTIAYSKFKNREKKYDYYRVYIRDEGLFFGDGYSKKTAIKKMKKGANIWAVSSSKARSLAKEVSPIKKTSGSERDKTHPKGKFKHYHPMKTKKVRFSVDKKSVHAFYGGPYSG